MGVVYKISFKDCDEFYIGSCVDLHKRKNGHKHNCFNEKRKDYNYKLYQFIRENYEWEDVIFEILEEYENVSDKLQLRKIEQTFMDKLKPTLNKYKAHQSKEENKEKLKEAHKIYYQENKEKLKEAIKIYREENKAKRNEHFKCDCKGKYIHNCRARHFKTKLHQDYLDLANSNK